MATTRNDRTSESRPSGSERPKRRPPRKGFDKDRATLWLLTVTLGLGLGAAARFVQRADAANSAANGSPTPSAQQAQVGSYGYQNQRVMVLPQQTYRSRALTRMS